jgi:hypothetical protein
MKYLSDYMSDKQTALFKKTGSFFAFGRKQFEEKRVEGVKYYNMGAGLLCPKETAKELSDGLDKIYVEAIAQDMEENGKKAIILRELGNHECWYTGDPEPCVDKLKDYPITKEEVWKVFKNKKAVLE